MDTDPNSYFGQASSSTTTLPQRPTSGHRANASMDTDPRAAAAHPSPKLGSGGPVLGQQRAPPSPKLAPSPAIPSTATPHAESSQAASRRNAAAAAAAVVVANAPLASESDLFTPFVSPGPAANPSRGAVSPTTSSEQLRHMIEEVVESSTCLDSSSPLPTAAGTAPSPPAVPAPEPSLLTCKPLDRVVSTQGTTSSQGAVALTPEWARRGPTTKEPMERMVSQAPFYMHPVYTPVKLKRARSISDPLERPNSFSHPHRQAKYYRAAGPRKKMRTLSPQDIVKQAQDERLMDQIRGRACDVSERATRLPPVNMSSLRMLDTNDVLRHPQNRHNLLFDNLHFRPVHDPVFAQTHYELQLAHRSQIVNASAPTASMIRFWDCIRAEVERGCRCTRWATDGRLKACICGGWKRDLSEGQWWREARATWPPRLPRLIQTLREILESLMASTTPCVNHYAHSMTRQSVTTHSSMPCPTVTHSLVPTLFAALDAEFLTIQVRRGNFDTDIFRVIGAAMKVHCAPVRDALVDDMVATALGTEDRAPDVVLALRKCFDCVEVMKLDIANHQVQSLKGMLWQQAEQNEMTTFINYLVAAHRTLETSKTFAWINAASKRVAMATPPRERRHLMSLCACASPTEFAIRSLSDGFIDLVFGNWYEDSEPWPPVVHSRRQGGYLGPPCFPTKVVIPEVFKMDWTRIKSFNAELVDIAIAHAILVTFRKRFAELDPTLSVEQISVQVASLLDCYKHVMSVGAGLSPDVYRDLAHQMASRVQGVTHDLAWEFACTISRDITHPEGEAFHASFASLRKLVHLMLTNTLLIHRVQPESFLYDMRGLDAKHCVRGEPIPTAARLRVQSRRFVTLTEPLTGQGPATSDPRERQHRPLATPAVASAREVFHRTVAEYRSAESAQAAESGFEPLVNDIRVVLDRMVKTADFNLCVFANLYARKGMLVGTGKLLPLPELPQN